MRKLNYILLLLSLISCNKSEILISDCKEYRFSNFKMCIPIHWKEIKMITYESSGIVFLNKGDSIFITNDNVEISDNPIIVNTQNEKNSLLGFSHNELNSDDIKIYKNRDFDLYNAVYKKNYYYYENIHGVEVLLVFPKNKNGTAGAFFNKYSTKSKLSIFCNNPSENTVKELKKVFNDVILYK